MKNSVSVGVAAAMLAATAGAASASYSVVDSQAAFDAGVGGAANVVSQDFQGFMAGDNMLGPSTFLSGVEVSSNMDTVQVFGGDKHLFGFDGASTARADGVAYYQFDYSLPYPAAGFRIESWHPNSGPATIHVFFDGGATDTFQVSQTGATESDPVFLGILSDTAITRVVIVEPIENDTGKSEEITFGIVEVSRIPAPGAASLAALGLIGFGGRRRR